MLEFWSAGNEIVNSEKAMQACMDDGPFGEPGAAMELLLLHTTMGHNFADLIETAKKRSPNLR